MNITEKIEHAAAKKLGRGMYGSKPGAVPDWPAWDAVARAAVAAGLDQPLLGYVRCDACTLQDAARAYVARYAQAYGPVGDIIDLSGYCGGREPMPARVQAHDL